MWNCTDNLFSFTTAIVQYFHLQCCALYMELSLRFVSQYKNKFKSILRPAVSRVRLYFVYSGNLWYCFSFLKSIVYIEKEVTRDGSTGNCLHVCNIVQNIFMVIHQELLLKIDFWCIILYHPYANFFSPTDNRVNY